MKSKEKIKILLKEVIVDILQDLGFTFQPTLHKYELTPDPKNPDVYYSRNISSNKTI